MACRNMKITLGVTIGEGAVVGARAAVFKDVEPWTVVGGHPVKFIRIVKPIICRISVTYKKEDKFYLLQQLSQMKGGFQHESSAILYCYHFL